jgi:aryl-alcohol dehydrogenase-like predicted oxidoreductase
VTFFDTAELYGGGTGANEQLLGRAVRGFRDEVVLATKFGFDMTKDQFEGEALDSRPEQGKNYEANVEAVAHLEALAEAQLALAWLLAQRDDIVPIPGTRNPRRLVENVAAAEVELTGADLDRIRQILPHGSYGSRYLAQHMPAWAKS